MSNNTLFVKQRNVLFDTLDVLGIDFYVVFDILLAYMIVAKLHDVLFQKGMNRAELAEKSHVGEHWLSKLYYGKLNTIHVPSMQRVCDVLDVKLSDIIEIVPDLPEGQNNEVSAPVGIKD